MGKKRMHAIIKGRVQGVFFRDHTREEAEKLGLTGWVRNLPDGTVEAEIEGNEQPVRTMITWLHTGSPLAEVTEVSYNEKNITNETGTFIVRY
ncbi:MAG: acylphosphatase [Desulfobulbaceae bacterium]|nr:acylphosphatase [Desulfobulbaceae bacterium]